MVGLDAAGKTTILYKLKLGEIVTTIPTIGMVSSFKYGGNALLFSPSRVWLHSENGYMVVSLERQYKPIFLSIQSSLLHLGLIKLWERKGSGGFKQSSCHWY